MRAVINGSSSDLQTSPKRSGIDGAVGCCDYMSNLIRRGADRSVVGRWWRTCVAYWAGLSYFKNGVRVKVQPCDALLYAPAANGGFGAYLPDSS